MRSRALLLIFVLGSLSVGSAQTISTGTSGPAPAAWVDDLSAITAADWTRDRAAHLVERAGFGETPDQIARLAAIKPDEVVNGLVAYDAIDNRSVGPFEESVTRTNPPAAADQRLADDSLFGIDPGHLLKFDRQEDVLIVEYLVMLQAVQQRVWRCVRRRGKKNSGTGDPLRCALEQRFEKSLNRHG